jgi:hypothetical protein
MILLAGASLAALMSKAADAESFTYIHSVRA